MNTAIIAAAGSGARMASGRAKQFLPLDGIPIIVHTLRQFERCDDVQEVIVVLPAEHASEFLKSLGVYGLRKVGRIVPGGTTRAESVQRGLSAIRSATAEIVVIHDGVRPFVTAEEISQTIDAAREHGAAILVAPAVDTIKRVNGNRVVDTLARNELRRALTPQSFRYELLRRAYEGVDLGDASITDDSLLVERLGEQVVFVEGSPRNIKITTQQDLLVAEAYLKAGEEK
jgi:2-C-methyl-D-erythritol 4-phosphate cytidylyltransferase